MGTPMAPNYANLFMDKFENSLLDDFEQKYGIRPMLWYRFIDDVFFIWTGTKEELSTFIDFTQSFSQRNNMKSKMKFEVSMSQESVNFLDVTVSLRDGKLETSLYSKPTDAHLYLNAKSFHPSHVIKNIAKGLLIRIRRICSRKFDYLEHGRELVGYLIKRGYDEKLLTRTLYQVSEISRDDLLIEKTPLKKDSQVIFVTDWHPALNKLPILLKKHFHVLQNDTKLSKVFVEPPTVAFRRVKSIRNYVVRNDIRDRIQNDHSPSETIPCGHCKLCKNIMKSLPVSGTKSITQGGDCKSRNLVYGAWCKKHKQLYVGQTGEKLCDRFSKHRYDIKKRPDNNELAAHFHNNHDVDKDLGVVILERLKVDNAEARKYYEDRWVCKLQSLQPQGINVDTGWYAKEMYACYQRSQ